MTDRRGVRALASAMAGAEQQTVLREQLAAAYAAGALAPGLRLLVEAQGELSEAARQDAWSAETAAAAFFEAEEPSPLRADALESVFARIAVEAPRRPPAEPLAARRASAALDEILRLPRAVHEPALAALGDGGWAFAGPGLRALKLDLSGDESAELLRIEPGWGAPAHSHRGGEYTLVLAGAFFDARGHYRAGDIAVAGPGLTHEPVAAPGAVCYCLSVRDAPLDFTGALGLLQKLWRH